jgi:hypothetical protein
VLEEEGAVGMEEEVHSPSVQQDEAGDAGEVKLSI